MNNYLHYFLIAILIFSSPTAIASSKKRYEYETYHLKNGLQVVLSQTIEHRWFIMHFGTR